jgi:serine/threonine protein kinase
MMKLRGKFVPKDFNSVISETDSFYYYYYDSTRSEKRVFLAASRERHPFLIGLHSCFQTETRVYFVMEYVSGGDLMLHIQRKQFSLRQAKFYACEVLLALEYFHAQGIIYR